MSCVVRRCNEVANLSARPKEHLPPTYAVPGAGAGQMWVQLLPAFPLQLDKTGVCLQCYPQKFKLAVAVQAHAGGLKPIQGTEGTAQFAHRVKPLLTVSQMHGGCWHSLQSSPEALSARKDRKSGVRGFLLAEMPRRPLRHLPEGLAHLGGSQCCHRRSPHSHGL